MKLQDIVIGLIIFSAVIIAGASFAVDLVGNYGEAPDEDFLGTYDKLSETLLIQSELSNKTEGAQIDETVGLVGMMKRGYQAVVLVFKTPAILTSIFTGLSEDFGFPFWVTPVAIAMLVIVIAFAIAKAMFRWDL